MSSEQRRVSSEQRRVSSEQRLIAVEEHFLVPELLEAGQRYLAGPAAHGSRWREAGAALEDADRERRGRMTLELGEGRIAAMDAAGIDLALLSISTAANLQMLEPAEGTALARLANDRLAAVRGWPERYAGLACVANQDPEEAAAEIERAAGTLNLNGVVINSHTRGEYLDAPRYARSRSPMTSTPRSSTRPPSAFFRL